MAKFLDADSELAVEIIPYLVPGNVPAEGASPLWVMVYSTRGRIDWRETGTDPLVLAAGQVRVSVDNSPFRTYYTPPPAWLDARQTSGIDLKASRDLELLLPLDRPVELSLLEKAEHRQPEVRALAVRSLSYLNIFEPSIKALNDESQHAFWAQHLDALQAGWGRGGESTRTLQAALEMVRGADARVLQRLMVGYSPQQLQDGGASELVALLEHRSMDVRVLAIENLRRITGVSKLYRPERPVDQQRRVLREWKQVLDAGQIAYREVPTPMPPAAK